MLIYVVNPCKDGKEHKALCSPPNPTAAPPPGPHIYLARALLLCAQTNKHTHETKPHQTSPLHSLESRQLCQGSFVLRTQEAAVLAHRGGTRDTICPECVGQLCTLTCPACSAQCPSSATCFPNSAVGPQASRLGGGGNPPFVAPAESAAGLSPPLRRHLGEGVHGFKQYCKTHSFFFF